MTAQGDKPAFPRPPVFMADAEPSDYWFMQDGMSLRDYFAAEVLQGRIAAGFPHELPGDVELAGRNCYTMADAMLAARDSAPEAPVIETFRCSTFCQYVGDTWDELAVHRRSAH